MGGDVNITVGKDVVQPIVEARIQAAIIEAFKGDNGTLLDELAGRILQQKVDSSGNPSRYDSDRTYIKWLCDQTIYTATKEAMQEIVASKKDKIKAAIVKQLVKNVDNLAAIFVEGIEKSLSSSWQFKCDVSFNHPK